MLQSSECPFAQCHNTMPRNPHILLERRMQSELNPAQIRPTSKTGAERKSLNPPNSLNRMQLLQTPEVPTAVELMFSDDPLESVSLQSDKPFMGQHKQEKEKQTYLPKLTENSLGGMGNTVLIPMAMQIPPDEKEVREELELLMMKLKDTLSLQTQPGISSPVILSLSSYLHPVYSIILFIIMNNDFRGNSESCFSFCSIILYSKVECILNISPNVGLIWNWMSQSS